MSEILTIIADYDDPKHGDDIAAILGRYARDPMGQGKDLSPNILIDVVAGMKQAGGFSVLAYHDGQAVGLSNCFWGYSTFKAAPLINIHDVAVDSAMRGMGIGAKLLDKIEQIAAEKGACKVTLEVSADNEPAKGLYQKLGYGGQQYFWTKELI